MADAYSATELMAVNAARQLTDGDVVLVGVGLPNLACNLALHTHAPNLVLVYESGVFGARPGRLPLSIGDPALVDGALMTSSMWDTFAHFLQRGHITVGFLGGAQIDRHGNLNSTLIGGDYAHPRVRLPGSGGSQEIAAWAGRTYLITPHERRRFPERVDFRTSVGLPGPHGRGDLPGQGPAAVITDLGILTPGPGGELWLAQLHPGATLEAARAATGWDLRASPDCPVTEPPGADELEILRSLTAGDLPGA